MEIDPLRILSGRVGAFARKVHSRTRLRYYHGRPFSRTADKRLLILSIDERIPQSQVHPFHVYADQILQTHGAEVREITTERYLSSEHPGLADATTICFQTGFDFSDQEFEQLLGTIRRRNPNVRLIYLDWFAPTDLRLAEMLDPHVSVYVKKQVLADPLQYGRQTNGDTNLTDYFNHRFGLGMPQTLFPIPKGFLDKLLVGPSFVTANFLLGTFSGSAPAGNVNRPIDLHARIAVKGSDWYQAMRSQCADAVGRLRGVNSVTGASVGFVRYLHELRSSKICFSPFGYGEVCWRDFEAVANGAVLLKPDMSHIRTDPDIFVAGETYMPVRWDLSDFQEKVHLLLGDADLRARLSNRAFATLHHYAANNRFVDQMARLFA